MAVNFCVVLDTKWQGIAERNGSINIIIFDFTSRSYLVVYAEDRRYFIVTIEAACTFQY
jgi:hypothetical protein